MIVRSFQWSDNGQCTALAAQEHCFVSPQDDDLMRHTTAKESEEDRQWQDRQTSRWHLPASLLLIARSQIRQGLYHRLSNWSLESQCRLPSPTCTLIHCLSNQQRHYLKSPRYGHLLSSPDNLHTSALNTSIFFLRIQCTLVCSTHHWEYQDSANDQNLTLYIGTAACFNCSMKSAHVRWRSNLSRQFDSVTSFSAKRLWYTFLTSLATSFLASFSKVQSLLWLLCLSVFNRQENQSYWECSSLPIFKIY